MPAPKSDQSGFHGDKIPGGRDLGAGSGEVTKGGTGYLTKSKSSRDGTVGAAGSEDNTAKSWVTKAQQSGAPTARIADGVDKPLPSA